MQLGFRDVSHLEPRSIYLQSLSFRLRRCPPPNEKIQKRNQQRPMAFSYDALTWHVILICILGTNANQMHKYAHMPTSNVPVLVRWLQRLRILQSARDHGAHHRGDKNMAYCVITLFLNPVLYLLGFWRGLERITVPIFGSSRREDLKHRQSEG